MIEEFIIAFNDSWTNGALDQLNTLLHKECIFVTPEWKDELKGREKCLQSIKEYIDNANTRSFEVTETRIHKWEATAVVHLEYLVEYEMNSQTYKEKGREIWTLILQNDTWLMVWRAMVKNEEVT